MNTFELWAMLPEALELVARVWTAHDVTPNVTAKQPAREGSQAGAVAVLPLVGPITPRGGGLFEMFFGGTSIERFRAGFQAALNDPRVGALVLDIDSPGGSVSGVAELADEVFAARGRKPIVAVSNTLMASAAYWIGAQADKVYVSPSSQTGSIGVYAVHLDMSAAYQAEGITPTLISAGKYKTEGHEFGPLDDDARAAWQEQVNTFYNLFVSAVARGRGSAAATVRSGYGEGRVLTAEAAVSAGLADKVGTLDDAIREADRLARRRAGAQAQALLLRVA